LSAAAGVLALPYTGSALGVTTIKSEVSIHAKYALKSQAQRRGVYTFHGRVRSDAPACVDQRNVNLMYKAGPGEPLALAGQDITGSDGKWSYTLSPEPGKYFAEASLKSFGNQKLCKVARSSKYPFGP
jgi:hypothetical protein